MQDIGVFLILIFLGCIFGVLIYKLADYVSSKIEKLRR